MSLKVRISGMICIVASATVQSVGSVELPDSSWVAHPGVTAAEMRALLEETRRDAAEGIWRTTGDGTEIALISGRSRGGSRTLGESYLMVIIDSPHPSLMPGTVMGVATPLAAPGRYDAEIYTRRRGGRLCRPRRFTLNLADGGHMTLREVHSGLRLSFTLRIPYVSRIRVTRTNDRPEDLDGLIREWPRYEGMPQRIRRL